MNQINNTDKIETTEQYVCSLVDILGQKEELLKLNNIDFEANVDEVKKIFQQTYGAIKKHQEYAKKSEEFVNKISQKHSLKTGYTSNDVTTKSFSDLIISYVSLRDDKHKLQFEGIYFLLFANCKVFLEMLSSNIALRGGIDLGLAIKHNDDELYGNALSKPYTLESKEASWIRIVIGQELYKYIYDCSRAENYSNEDIDYNIAYAKLCMKIIIKDIDGKYILDYLSEEFHDFDDFKEYSKKAKSFLEQKAKKYENDENEKIYTKYAFALNYFEDKLNEQ